MGFVLSCLTGQALSCVASIFCSCCGFLTNRIKFTGSVSTRFTYAGIFLLTSILVLLVDFAHNLAEYCIEKYEETESDAWKFTLVGGTSAAALVFISLIVAHYAIFAKNGCSLNQFFATVNLILCAIACFLAVHPKVQEANLKSGLAQAAMVCLYASYLVTSAMIGVPVDDPSQKKCNPLIDSDRTRTTLVVFGAIFTMAAISYSASTAATKSGTLIKTSDYESLSLGPHRISDDISVKSTNLRSQAIKDAVAAGSLPESSLADIERNSDTHDSDDDSSTLTGSQDDEKLGVQYNYSFFHFIFCIAAMYMAMLLTNWNSINANSGDFIVIGRSMTAVWAKIITSWLCIILYCWTLLAPVIMPERYYY
ncbi:hypothetical protein BB561_002541 [Smittium simulii]|uniref:Membrane protein TMS1 n=1 Tax=Smittium simulii TaxID=133385 RepID=A0A2T9YQB6_9FUNG|nr:hypothetical protein BB561_002541 [Smittium simulii]